MRAVILAAGIGSRLGELGKQIPKCLIDLGGKTILERQIEILENCGISKRDIVVVIGDRGEVWSEENKERVRNIHDNLIVNTENVIKNQSYSLWLALQKIEDSVICMDGDTLFDRVILKELIKHQEKSILPFRKARENDTRRKILTTGGRVVKISKDTLSDKIYTPLIKLDKELVEGIKQELALGTYFNDSLETIINKICDKFKISVLSLEPLGTPDRPLIININTPQEYSLAQKLFGQNANI